jgi:hypothetical protein
MRPETYRSAQLVRWFEKMRILAWERIAQALGRPSRITVFRKLAQLGARASYSHGGRFHTLDRLAAYDKNGLWSFRGVRFSRNGTLEKTIVYLVEHSPEGYFASELEALVQVRVHNTLAHLYALGRLDREQLVDQYLYLSPTTGKQQLEKRYESIRRAQEQRTASRPEVPAELRESIDFLLSVLHEKQRRLYLGLESLRLGRGGDSHIARMAGVDVKTVAQGRRQLLARQVTAERIREAGAGRPALKKHRSDRPTRESDGKRHGRRPHE